MSLFAPLLVLYKARADVVAPVDDRQDTEYYSSDGASNKVDRIKQVTTKHIVVAAHHDPNFGTYKLRERRFGNAAGVGKWSLFLWSDSVSVAP